jgi:hypothetical protein
MLEIEDPPLEDCRKCLKTLILGKINFLDGGAVQAGCPPFFKITINPIIWQGATL